ncbi:MAG: Holliday junction branch migration protein RuvA [Erysipelotrichaceae bacterium]|nr:Holliday junction branch migration protein RuvA [Erysipelotrichaceae bacterium]
MIGFLRGIVHYFGMDYVLLDVNNVGYRINFYHPECLKIGQEIIIYTYENIREDEQTLFGFLSLDEYDLFVKLISVKGLGPKIASNILARAKIETIIEAIENSDVAFMKSMPNVGAKTASQIILDLKGKLVSSTEEKVDDAKMKDVAEALKSLGYKPSEIKPVIRALSKEEMSTDEYIKAALKMLMKKL